MKYPEQRPPTTLPDWPAVGQACSFRDFMHAMQPGRAAYRRQLEFPPRSPQAVEPPVSPRAATPAATPDAYPHGSGDGSCRPTARPTGPPTPSSSRPQAHASVIVKVHRHTWNVPMPRPHEPHLLLARPDDLLTVPEGGLQRESIGHGRQDLGNGHRRVGAEERHPAGRLIQQHHTDQPAGRTPRRQEGLVLLDRRPRRRA